MASIAWPWAILLCRFSDVAAEPQPRGFYADLYTANGTGGLVDYWRTATSGALDLSTSQVFGWFGMEHAFSEVAGLTFPGDRAKLAQWGIDAAKSNGVDLSPFRAKVVVLNSLTDHGASGPAVVISHHDPKVCEFGFICHEMGHGMGLPHSWSASPDLEYGDGWDVMSFATTTFLFPYAFQGTTGLATVGLNARNLAALGAIPPGRNWQPAGPDYSATVTLDPLNQAPLGNHGSLVVTVPPQATRPNRPSQSTYTAEYRHKAGWDEAIPEDSVSIRETRPNGLSYLQPGIWGRLVPGTTFTTPDPPVSFRVTVIDTTLATATLRIWDLPDGCVRKEDSKPKVYLIENRAKRWITSPSALMALGKTWADVHSVPDGALANVPDGPDLTAMTISVTPYPVKLRIEVSVLIDAVDAATGAPIAGDVMVDGTKLGATGTPFSHTFRPKRIVIPNTKPPEYELVYPTGKVRAPGYPDAQVNFGFPDN